MQAGNGSTPEQAAALQRELSLITREIVELTEFREQTMSCLVKLVAANMNPAFRYLVNLFHHRDTHIKQALSSKQQLQLLNHLELYPAELTPDEYLDPHIIDIWLPNLKLPKHIHLAPTSCSPDNAGAAYYWDHPSRKILRTDLTAST
jgi:hypothetical protein